MGPPGLGALTTLTRSDGALEARMAGPTSDRVGRNPTVKRGATVALIVIVARDWAAIPCAAACSVHDAQAAAKAAMAAIAQRGMPLDCMSRPSPQRMNGQ